MTTKTNTKTAPATTSRALLWRVVTATTVTEKRGGLATVKKHVEQMVPLKNGWTGTWSDELGGAVSYTVRNSKGIEQKKLGVVIAPGKDLPAKTPAKKAAARKGPAKKAPSQPAKAAAKPGATKRPRAAQKTAQPASKVKAGPAPIKGETFSINDVWVLPNEDGTLVVHFNVLRKVGAKKTVMEARAGWQVKDDNMADRLGNAIWWEKAVTDFHTRVDVNGKEYVGFTSHVMGKRMNADLKKIGY